MLRNLFLITRPLSNIKNIFILFIALYISKLDFNISKILISFISISFISSAIYSYNSYTDFNYDKKNPVKKHHYEQTKNFGYKKTFYLFIILSLIGFSLSFLINYFFSFWLAIYWLINFLYSYPKTRFKEKFLLDILFGGSFTYSLRFISLWYTFSINFPPISIILILFFLKTGSFILYKFFDREFYLKENIKNSFTILKERTQLIISFTSFIIATSIFITLSLNGEYIKIDSLIQLPINFLYFLIPILVVLFIAIHYSIKKGIKTTYLKFKKLRRLLILYSFINLIIFLWLIIK